MDEITRDWLEVFRESKERGEDLSCSVFWRLALHTLPLGVDGNCEEVKQAVREIQEAVNRSER